MGLSDKERIEYLMSQHITTTASMDGVNLCTPINIKCIY